jgi:hypothetical protein
MRFSERMGYRQVSETLQVETVSDALWNRMRNLLEASVLTRIARLGEALGMVDILDGASLGERFVRQLYDELFKAQIPRGLILATKIWDHLWEACQAVGWHCIYDLLEFTVQRFPYSADDKARFVSDLNRILEEELAGYRVISDEIAPVTSEIEIQAIQQAVNGGDSAEGDPVAIHLQRALELLADREERDYRNSVKESISAVESLCSRLAGEKTSLGKALDVLGQASCYELHPALLGAFDKLYGYSSNEDGIRHAILEADKILLEDAKFMLVTCSAFVNYVRAKQARQQS